MGLAMAELGMEPEAIDYVSYRGTSTELNGRIETRAMHLAFGAHAPLLAGSALKSVIGHPQGSFGAGGLAATLLAMRDRVMHGTLHLDGPDPARKINAEHAVCNCIAFGNKNSALVAGCG